MRVGLIRLSVRPLFRQWSIEGIQTAWHWRADIACWLSRHLVDWPNNCLTWLTDWLTCLTHGFNTLCVCVWGAKRIWRKLATESNSVAQIMPRGCKTVAHGPTASVCSAIDSKGKMWMIDRMGRVRGIIAEIMKPLKGFWQTLFKYIA